MTTNAVAAARSFGPSEELSDLPKIGAEQVLDLAAIRDPRETRALRLLMLMLVMAAVALVYWVAADPERIGLLAGVCLYLLLVLPASWVGWKLIETRIVGDCIEVGEVQYPQIDRVVKQAVKFLGIEAPRVLVMQGHGMLELFVAKRFQSRTILILTSHLVEEFSNRPTSRELMFFVGRQLGHIRAGHFDNWFLMNVIGRVVALPAFLAWKRYGHITADRIGLLCAGDIDAAERGLLTLTVGSGLAPGTNFDALRSQREQLTGSIWALLENARSTYPFMIVRLARLRDFAASLGMFPAVRNSRVGVGVFPIAHANLRCMPVLLIHGHDRLALLELQNLIFDKFPNVAPRVMSAEQFGSLAMSEKFERVSEDLMGAIALLTPDDPGAVAASSNGVPRARQNVVLEIGWVWGALGRNRVLLLKRGEVEIPSDLSGVDVQTFHVSPSECALALHGFIGQLQLARHAER